VLLTAVLTGMLWPYVRATFWPVTPSWSGVAGASVAVLGAAGLHRALRALGPVALSRPAASFLLTAPVDRRSLLAPVLWLTGLGAAGAGGLVAVIIIGHVLPRPVPTATLVLLPVVGVLLGVAVLLMAVAGQAGRRWARGVDGVAVAAVALGIAGLLVDSVSGDGGAGGAIAATVAGGVAVVLAVVVGVLIVLAVRRLARTPNDEILEASRTAGTLFDSAYGVEPSFVTDLAERRYWAHRRLRSVRSGSRLPVLTGQDLLLARRRPGRLLALAGLATVPALAARGPGWLPGAVLLLGAMVVGSTTAATVRNDSRNPVLLRQLALSSRQVAAQRLWVPGVLASVWCAAALVVLQVFGDLPDGPWWALGVTLGPVGGVAAVHRARAGYVQNGLLPLETPFGSISTGVVLASVMGPDMLLLGLPAAVRIAGGAALTWTAVAVQAAVSVIGTGAYLAWTTSRDRVDLGPH
jgi:hypothetical protein